MISDDLKLKAHLAKATPQVGAEHTPYWLLGIANANADPTDIKAHVLRFLGMYNVADLLTFTIGAQFILESASNYDDASAREGSLTWFDPVIYFLSMSSVMMSGFGLMASTILYNTASSVHEVNFTAFAKSKATGMSMLMVNDLSIFGFVPLIFSCVFSSFKIGFLHNSLETPLDIAKAIGFSAFFLMFPLLMYKQSTGVALTTHYSLYGGLMSVSKDSTRISTRRERAKLDELQKMRILNTSPP